MLKLNKIAITGGVASGKSTVCSYLQELGAYVVSCDAIVHELLKTDSHLIEQLVKILGKEILQNGEISRKVVAEKTFKDLKQLKKIEALIHPRVLEKIEALYQYALHQKKYSAFVVEIPLLFEIGAETLFDITITVITNEPIAKSRFKQTNFESRMSRQLTPKQKAEKSHFTIYNNGSLDQLQDVVIKLYKTIQNQ